MTTLLHIGGASTASVIVSLVAIFLLMLIMSFAFWRGPQEERRFSGPWLVAWIKASTPRVIVAGLFCTGLFFASYFSNGSDSANTTQVCADRLFALTEQPVTDLRMAGGVAGLRDLAESARAGDIERARELIFSDAHSVTHDVDARLRPIDEALARDLCESILTLEDAVLDDDAPDLEAAAQEAERAATLLEQARTVLASATPPPGESPVPTGAPAVCNQPVGAATSEPVTADRIQNAISRLEAVAAAAADGDAGAITDSFNGDAHDLTHDIDGPLRETDEDLARRLCLSVIEIELQIAGRYDFIAIEREAERSAQMLAESQEALGLEE